MIDDDEILRVQNKTLERENRELRQTLRDQFATAALTGLIAATQGRGVHLMSDITDQSYDFADSMLAARKGARR